VSALVTDTSANMVAAGRLLEEEHGVPWHGCLAHLLELITGIFFKAAFVRSTMLAARKLVGAYTMSPQAEELLFQYGRHLLL
jgi:hypothetical protein